MAHLTTYIYIYAIFLRYALKTTKKKEKKRMSLCFIPTSTKHTASSLNQSISRKKKNQEEAKEMKI